MCVCVVRTYDAFSNADVRKYQSMKISDVMCLKWMRLTLTCVLYSNEDEDDDELVVIDFIHR